MRTFSIWKTAPPTTFIKLYIFSLFVDGRRKAEPVELPFPMFFVCRKIPNVNVSIWIDLDPKATPRVLDEIAFIYFSRLFDQDSLTIALFVTKSSKIYFVCVFDKPDFLESFLDNLFDIDFTIGKGFILDEEITKLLLIFLEDSLYGILFFAHLQPQQLMIDDGWIGMLDARV